MAGPIRQSIAPGASSIPATSPSQTAGALTARMWLRYSVLTPASVKKSTLRKASYCLRSSLHS